MEKPTLKKKLEVDLVHRRQIFEKMRQYCVLAFGTSGTFTERENFLAHSFCADSKEGLKAYEERMTQIKLYIEATGNCRYDRDEFNNSWGATPIKHHKTGEIIDVNLGQLYRATKTYLTIKLDLVTGTIRVQLFEKGWDWSYKKKRLFPLTSSKPLLTLNQKMWYFTRAKKPQPRLVKGNGGIKHVLSPEVIDLMGIMLQRESSIFTYPLQFSTIINSNNVVDAIKLQYGVQVPKLLLKHLPPQGLSYLIKLIEPHHYTKLCQTIITHKLFTNEDEVEDEEYDETMHNYGRLGKILHVMLDKNDAINGDNVWLIRDWMGDHLHLKRKLNLSIKSLRRVSEDHQEMTRLRVLEGLPDITVDDKYADLAKFPGHIPVDSWELVADKDRLSLESAKMHHCVATYANKINRGDCAIISVSYQGRPYTMEVGIGREQDGWMMVDPRDMQQHIQASLHNTFTLFQLRGIANAAAPSELLNPIADWLRTIYPIKNLRS